MPEIYYNASRRRFCPKGHDTHVVGRYRSSRTCVKCMTSTDNRFKLYGISAEVWHEMLKAQNGLCAICRHNEAIVVDHNHCTGRVRELLCQPCNRGLGQFRDSAEALARAAEYLERHG